MTILNKDTVINVKYLLYEFMGTALICIAYNMCNKVYGPVWAIVVLWSWNLSAGHFNMSLTLGQLAMQVNSGAKLAAAILPCIILIIV